MRSASDTDGERGAVARVAAERDTLRDADGNGRRDLHTDGDVVLLADGDAEPDRIRNADLVDDRHSHGDAEPHADHDRDADAHPDANRDPNAVAHDDRDTLGEPHGDPEPDADRDPDVHDLGDADGSVDRHRHADSDSDTHTEPDHHRHLDSDGDGNDGPDTNGNRHGELDADGHADADGNPHPDRNGDHDRDGFTHGILDSDPDAERHGNCYGNPDDDADRHPDAHTDPDTQLRRRRDRVSRGVRARGGGLRPTFRLHRVPRVCLNGPRNVHRFYRRASRLCGNDLAMVRDCHLEYPQTTNPSEPFAVPFRRNRAVETIDNREVPMLHVQFPHVRRVRSYVGLVAALFATCACLAFSGTAHADALRCKREVVKASAKFVQAKLRTLQKCEDGVLMGKISGPCPDVKGAAAIAKASTKLRAAIDKKCGGADKDCTTAGDNDALASINWGSTCPNFEGGTCDNAITTCDGISNCLLCVDEAAVDQGIGLYYDALTSSSDPTVKKCQREIGKSAVKFLRLKSKVLQKCNDKIITGQLAGPCPDPKSAAMLANAAAKMNTKLCSTCGGGDRVCGGPDDLLPATIGFPATCPSVTPPGGTSCGGSVGTLQQLVSCVGCVSNFKAECVDRIAAPSVDAYPSECSGGTPPPNCGNDVLEAGEQCDGTADAACPGNCTAMCACGGPCVLPSEIPAKVSFVGRTGSDLDTGWTGIGHDSQTVTDAALMAGTVSNCDLDTGSPTCGQCDLTGPIANPGPAKNCVCSDLGTPDASSLTVCDPQAPSCGGGETCECLLGPPLPISAGAIPVCVLNRLTGPVTGTANISDSGPHAGEGAVQLQLVAAVHNGEAVEQPCPVCLNDPTPRDGVKGGTCKDGVRNGQPCDVGGTNEFFGALSIDCQPSSAKNIGNLSIGFKPATTGETQLATNRPCTDAPGQNCFCDTCATLAAEPCNTNADCPGGAVCGGRRCVGGTNAGAVCTTASQCPSGFCNRPGQPTKPNGCADGACSLNVADGPTEGFCENGPIDQSCNLEPFRGCSSNADCNPPPSGNCPTCLPGQSCGSSLRQCFLDPIVRHGVADTQTPVVAATFCIPPTSSQSVNQVAGLPGPGALALPTRVFKLGAQCGNDVVNAGEACDGTADGACPGACQIDCQCAGCGNDVVDPGEQCDGIEDAACPGQCQGNCQCIAATCGNDTVELGEDCDGTADAACPGNCQPDCSCGAVCGNNVVEGSEQCDGAGSVACPAESCQPDCTCGVFCGNNQIDPGEECDGNGTGACAGTCQGDCQCAPFCGNDEREGSELCDGDDDGLCPGQCSVNCTCPASATITFTVADGADLDTGWTGTAHDFAVQKGSRISGELSSCDGVSDFECDFFGNVGSACAADPSTACLTNAECSAGGCNINTFGPPLPLSAGGVPACIVNRFATDVTGSYNLQTGDADLFTRLSALVHLGVTVREPCPICDCGLPDPDDCTVGSTGTCSSGGGACTVQGVGPLGPTSNDCMPSVSSNVSGGGLDIGFQPVTTGTSTFASNQPCDGSGHTGESCWCDGQPQANQCANACDGGSNDAQPCAGDGDCPGAGAGACKPLCRQIVGQAVGEGECVGGPPTQTCANAPEIGCQTNSNCPGATGPCVASNQRCFMDPIVKVGTPGTATNVSVATFCIPATTASAINQTAGLPGPGAILFPNDIDLKRCGDDTVNRFVEECDGTDDTNCPGSCLANCTCDATCGNDVIEFGEQCDGTQDSACPGQCGAPATENPCVCPASCGDGFVGPGEECEAADDSACPGQCTACNCPVPTATCLNNTLDPGEPCEVPAVGCGPSQACLLCQQCFPDLSPIVNELGFICGNLNVEPTETCELPAIGCGAGQLCNNCTSCVDFIPFCGNLNIEPGEACELPAVGCGPNQLCLLCGQCVDVPLSICGNLNIEAGEVCELPQQGCGPLALCALCQQCIPLL